MEHGLPDVRAAVGTGSSLRRWAFCFCLIVYVSFVWGLGFRVQGLGFRDKFFFFFLGGGGGSGVCDSLWFRIRGLGGGRVGEWVWGSGFQVEGFWSWEGLVPKGGILTRGFGGSGEVLPKP